MLTSFPTAKRQTTPLVRPASAEDIAAITEIFRAAVLEGTASSEIEPPDESEMRRRFETITDTGYPYLVAEVSGQVVGFSYASVYQPTRPAYRYSVEDSVYVAPEAHRRGVGRALLAALIESCTQRGFRQMIAVINDWDQIASIWLHRALGFAVSGTIHAVAFKHGRWLDSVVMQRPLGDGDRTPPGHLTAATGVILKRAD
jgi:L-amino acid N-acyltransferase YncA